MFRWDFRPRRRFSEIALRS